jgi:hypothetical protein
MADSNKEFQIRITSTAQLQSVQQTQQELERAIKTTRQLGGDTSVLEGQLRRVDAALGSEAAKAASAVESLKEAIKHTKALGGETTALEAALGRAQERMGANEGALSRFGQRIEEARKAYKDAGGGLSGATALLGSFGGGFAKLAEIAAGLLAVAGAAGVAKKSVGEFAEGEEALTTLEQAVANQGRLTEAYASDLSNLAAQLEKVTAIAKTQWMAVLEELTKHGADASNIKQYAEAVKNLAGLIGVDVVSAAQMFSKALNGNFEWLQRHGISIKENATAAERLRDVMEQLSDRGAGILEDKAKGLNGQLRSLKLAFNDVFESIGGLIARTGLVQGTLELTTSWFRFLTGLFPELHVGVDKLTNRLPGLNQGLNEAGAAAESSAAGLGMAQSAVDKLKDSFDAAKSSAEAFRKQQDDFDDEQLANQLAYIDNQQAKGAISPGDARLARAGFRLAANQRKADREAAGLREEENRLRGDESAAFNKSEATASVAATKGARRDQLLRDAKGYFGLESDQQIELRNLRALLAGGSLSESDRKLKETREGQLTGILASGSGLTYGQGIAEARERAEREFKRADVASRNNPIIAAQLGLRRQKLSILDNLPGALSDAQKAEAEAASAKTNYENVFGQTSPRREADETQLQILAYRKRRGQLENETEVLNTYRDSGNGSGLGRGFSSGGSSGFGNFGAEMEENKRRIDGFGNEVRTVLKSQNAILQSHTSDLQRIAREVETIKRQAAAGRNNH